MNGDKANDLWKYDFATKCWTMVCEGDYKKQHHMQDATKCPAPRIGCRMMKVKDDIYIHNGHDNENEKLGDMWKYNLTENIWSKVE